MLRRDDAGDIVDSIHIRLDLDDSQGQDPQGQPITIHGLRTRLMDESAVINQDGKLVIDGTII